MKIIVLKFGGTSVGTTDRIKKVAKIIAKYKKKYNVIVLSSAMSGVTNNLINLSKKISKNFSDSEYDVLVSSGEQISCALISGELINNGLVNDQNEIFYSSNRIKFTLIEESDNFSTVFRVGIPDSANQKITTYAREELEKELEFFSNKPYITDYGITGSPFVRDIELSSATNSLYKSIPIAAFASFLVLLITFRSIKYALVTVLPIGLVVSWLYGIMYLGGYSLNLVTATIGAISIGVGIDFSIHITQRVREELRKSNYLSLIHI